MRDIKEFNKKATPEDIELMRDYKKNLRECELKIYRVTGDMKAVGMAQHLIEKKIKLLNIQTEMKKQISDLFEKYAIAVMI